VRLIANGLKGFQYGTISKSYFYALNFFAFGTFSPLKTLSAPTFLPSLGQPYFGPNKLRNILQEVLVVRTNEQAKMNAMWRDLTFIAFVNRMLDVL
jgi:hypothetical protein